MLGSAGGDPELAESGERDAVAWGSAARISRTSAAMALETRHWMAQ